MAYELTYSLIKNGTAYNVTGYTGEPIDVVIPKEYNALPVTSIGSFAFRKCSSLTSVEIHDSITEIGSFAFRNCSSLTEIVIPDSVTSIGWSAFEGCRSLTSIEVDEENTVYKDIDGNLYSKDGSILIQYAIGKTATEFIIPDSVTSIGSSAFRACNSLTSVEIPDSVTSIGGYAFKNCDSLTSVVIGDSVTNIGNSAFEDCSSLTSVEIGDGVTSIGSSAFSGCGSLTSVVIGDSVTSIGNHVFSECSSLTSVVIPDSVTSIGNYAFYDCDALTFNTYGNCKYLGNENNPYLALIAVSNTNYSSYTIHEETRVIGESAFLCCESLMSIEIPDSVTSIGNDAFYGCDSLTNITILSKTPATIDTSTFSSISNDAKFYCHSSAINAYKTATNWNTYSGKFVADDMRLYFTMNSRAQKKYFASKEWVLENVQSSGSVTLDINLENGYGEYSLVQKGEGRKAPIASGFGAVAFGGFRGDKPEEQPTEDDRTNVASGIQSAVFGCGNLAAGDWTAVSGKDNTVYSNRAFVSGGKNVSQAVDYNGNFIEEKTNAGRFNAIFGNNNTFKSSNTAKESNLIAGGSNTVDTERSIVVGYSNNVSGYYNAVFGLGNTVNADRSLIGGEKNTINGAYHLAAGSNNEVSGQFNITSGQDNNNAGWSSAAIGKGLVVGKGYTGQTVLGQYNDNKSNTVLEIGWGTKDAPKNIFEVYDNGAVKTEQGTLSTQEYVNETVAAPKTKLKIGTNNTDADAVDSLTVGTHSLNRGYQSAAIGYDAYVGYNSDGSQTSKQPTGAVALNWSRANADYCLSAGYDTEVNHSYSVALNNKTKTGAVAQTVVGSYNAAKSTTAFEVGNGSASERKNAFEVLKDGRAKVQSAPIDNDDVVRLADINKAVEEKIAEASVKNAVKITKYLNQGGGYNQTLEVAPSGELPGNVSLYQNAIEIAVDGPTTKNLFEFKLSPNQKALLEDNLTLQSIKFKDTLTAAQFNSPAIKNNGCISLSFSFEDRPSPTYLPITVVVSNDGSLAAQGSAWYSINTENFELTINFDNYISVANSHSDEQYILNGYLIIPLTLDNKEFTLSYSNGNIYLSKYITEEYKIVTQPLYQSDCRNLRITSPTGAPAYLQINGDSGVGSNIAGILFEPITYDITSNARATLRYEGLPLSLLD